MSLIEEILILGDEYAKNFSSVLRHSTGSKYSIKAIVKPDCELSHLTGNLFADTLDYGQEDYVIIMFNTNNVSNNKNLYLALKQILPLCKITNILLISERHILIDQIIIRKVLKQVFNFRKHNSSISLRYLIDNKVKGSKCTVLENVKQFLTFTRSNISLKTINTCNAVMTCLTSLRYDAEEKSNVYSNSNDFIEPSSFLEKHTSQIKNL